jgi:DNA-nicking Smr family endonuclease
VRRRAPSEDERALWRAALANVKPLPGRPAPPPVPPATPAATAAEPAAPAAPKRAGRGLDRRTAERLKRGEMPIEARLDLHGMTEAEAHTALHRFLARSHAAERRCVIVITGKGAVLRAAVPRWLEEGGTRERILAATPAQPRHGGGGALYVLLRRVREGRAG